MLAVDKQAKTDSGKGWDCRSPGEKRHGDNKTKEIIVSKRQRMLHSWEHTYTLMHTNTHILRERKLIKAATILVRCFASTVQEISLYDSDCFPSTLTSSQCHPSFP